MEDAVENAMQSLKNAPTAGGPSPELVADTLSAMRQAAAQGA